MPTPAAHSLHHQMDDTADFAVSRQFPAGSCACSNPRQPVCDAIGGGSCGLTRKLSTRPSLWQRLKRWWRRGQLRAELAALEADRADCLDRLGACISYGTPWTPERAGRLQLAKLDLQRVDRDIAAKHQQLATHEWSA